MGRREREGDNGSFTVAVFLKSCSNQLCHKLYNYHRSENNGVLAKRLHVGR